VGRREDDNESRCRRKFEKGKEPATKDAVEEPFVNDTKFIVDLLMSAFIKLQDVGEAFDIKAPHEVDMDPIMKGLALRIHWLAEKLENLPVVERLGCHFIFDDNGDDDDDGSHNRDNDGTPTAATNLMIDSSIMYMNNVCVCVFVSLSGC
jgi:hypothetical protein